MENIKKELEVKDLNDSNKTKNYGKIKDEYENVYEGEIMDGKANGKGTKTYKDGRIYTGLFKDNQREGKGILIRPDGTKYIGNYKNDDVDGIGININNEGRELVALFIDGKPIKGKAIMYYGEPNKNNMHFTNRYEGDYQNKKREGYGKFVMANGDIYEGEFQNDEYNGKGIYYWANGNKYEGQFKNNQKEGKGIFTFNNGIILDCMWKNDLPLMDN